MYANPRLAPFLVLEILLGHDRALLRDQLALRGPTLVPACTVGATPP